MEESKLSLLREPYTPIKMGDKILVKIMDIQHFVERHFIYCAISSKRLFVEVSFCRMSTLSKQVFVEYFRRNILCSTGRHVVSADPVTMYHVTVRLRTLGKITDLKLTAVSIRVLVNETRG